ncbi:MAG: Rieske 2Fe-2S domain-containing protein [Planctomycetota bacterium]|nr:Rieske 2Fe-2S domain-containing protein [Planctomycetota bacterium]
MPKFVKVCRTSDVPPGECRLVEAHDKPIALFNIDGTFQAINQVCPHRGGPLAEGRLEGNVVACPWHGWTFCVDTGLPDHEGGHSVSAYEVRVEGDDVLIGWLKP